MWWKCCCDYQVKHICATSCKVLEHLNLECCIYDKFGCFATWLHFPLPSLFFLWTGLPFFQRSSPLRFLICVGSLTMLKYNLTGLHFTVRLGEQLICLHLGGCSTMWVATFGSSFQFSFDRGFILLYIKPISGIM